MDALLLDVTPCEHSLLRADHHFDRQLGTLPKRPRIIREARHISSHKTINHAAAADDFARENTRIDGCFCVVAHNAPMKLHGGCDAPLASIKRNSSVGVFEVAIARARAEIDPTSKVGVPEKTMVLLVRERFDGGRLHLPADFCRVRQADIILEGSVFDHF